MSKSLLLSFLASALSQPSQKIQFGIGLRGAVALQFMSSSSGEPSTRSKYLYMAKIAEQAGRDDDKQAGRYDDMADYMHEVAKIAKKESKDLSLEERNLLSVAFKNAVNSRRASWKDISKVEDMERAKENKPGIEGSKEYKQVIEKELDYWCNKILDVLETNLIIDEQKLESNPTMEVNYANQVFYHKMKGDYHCYKAEYKQGDAKAEASQAAKDAYETGMKVAEFGLDVTHPIRLGLALNFSVFYYEVLDKPEDACKIARSAYEDAIVEFDTASDSEESYFEDYELIIGLLRDNLILWTSDSPGGD